MDIIPKLTFYDSLCMMVCGYIILCIMMGTLNPNGNVLFYVFCYLVGLVYHRLLEMMTPCLRNIPCMIKQGRESVKEGTSVLPPATRVNYNKAYYLLMDKQCLNNIPILEAQAAFCKDMFLLLLSLLVGVLSSHFEGDGMEFGFYPTSLFLLALIIALVFVWYYTQMKIHHLVWEGYYYIFSTLNHYGNEETDS